MTPAAPSNQMIAPRDVAPYCWPTPGAPGAWGETVGTHRVQAGTTYGGLATSNEDLLSLELTGWICSAHDALSKIDEYIDELEGDEPDEEG